MNDYSVAVDVQSFYLRHARSYLSIRLLANYTWADNANKYTRLVLETLTPLSGDRKCFRMINGVLVERTVSDVLPALQTNADGLKKVLDDLVKQYKSKQEEMEKWKVGFVLAKQHSLREC